MSEEKEAFWTPRDESRDISRSWLRDGSDLIHLPPSSSDAHADNASARLFPPLSAVCSGRSQYTTKTLFILANEAGWDHAHDTANWTGGKGENG